MKNDRKEVTSLVLLITWHRPLPRSRIGQSSLHLLGLPLRLQGPLRVLPLSEHRANLQAMRPQL